MANLLNVVSRAGEIFPGLTTPGTPLGDITGGLPQVGNVQRFYTAMSGGKGSGLLPFGIGDSAYKLQHNYLFDIVMTFNPATSNVFKEMRKVLTSFSVDSIRYLIQSIDIPDIELTDGPDNNKTQFGYSVLPGRYVLPSTNELSIDFLSAETSILDNVFYYWMKEISSNTWVYPTKPYTTCNIYISFLDQKDVTRLNRFVFNNVIPISISAPKLSQEAVTADSFIRTAKFMFSNLIIAKPSVLSGITKLISGIARGQPASQTFGDIVDFGISRL